MKKIPIRVTWAFLITAGFLGFLISQTLIGTFVWMGIIFVSVLFHELGHALGARLFGQRPRIELVAFGGVTIPSGPKLKAWKEFIVVLMGPLFGFILFVAASIALQFPYGTPFVRAVLASVRDANLFWTFINLLPVVPLDGGHLVRIFLEMIFGPKSWKFSLYVSLAASTILSIVAFLIGFYIMGAIFLLFAFQGIEGIRRLSNFSPVDQDESNQHLLQEAEKLMAFQDISAAEAKLHLLAEKTGRGLIHTRANEDLAKIYYHQGKHEEVYALLFPIEKQISKEAKILLYFSAYEMKDFDTVIHLSGLCFQESESLEVAICAARAHAMLKEIKKSIEWLKTARSFGPIDLSKLALEPAFDGIRDSEQFEQFLKSQSL